MTNPTQTCANPSGNPAERFITGIKPRNPPRQGGKENFKAMTSWEKRVWTIFDKASQTTDQGIRKALYEEWQILFAKNLPVIMIAKGANAAVVSNKIGNFVWNLGVIPGYNPVPLIYNK